MQGTLLERMDRETRALVILAAATVVFVAAAAFALASSARGVAPSFKPVPFFPDLGHKLGAAQELMIQTKDEKLRIVRAKNGQWVLPDKDNYPVRREPLRETLLGLTELMKVQPATANVGWYNELRLGAPGKGGEATRYTLKGKGGTVLATLLVGEKADIPDVTGLDSYYVRLPGEKQSWLARGTLSTRLDPTAWIVTDVVPLAENRIRSATVTPPEGPSYTVARKDKKTVGFTLMNPPQGKVMSGPRVADSVAQSIANLKIKDARLASDFNFSNAPSIRFRTFDGLEITVRTLALGKDVWGTIAARFDGQPGGNAAKSFDSSSQAANINKRVAGWAFLMPTYEGNQMRRPLSDLVKDAGPAKAGGPAEKGGDQANGQKAGEAAEKPAATPPEAAKSGSQTKAGEKGHAKPPAKGDKKAPAAGKSGGASPGSKG